MGCFPRFRRRSENVDGVGDGLSKLRVRAAATGLDATRGSRRDGAALGNYTLFSPTSDGGIEASTTVSVLRRTAVDFSSSVSHHLKLAKFQAPRRRRRWVDVDVGSADLDFGRPRHSHFFCQYSILIAAYSPPTSHSARGRGISRRHGSHEPAEGSAGRGAIQAPAGAADVTSPTNLTTRASRKPPTGKTTTQHFRTPLP